jgi:hypothetical protein
MPSLGAEAGRRTHGQAAAPIGLARWQPDRAARPAREHRSCAMTPNMIPAAMVPAAVARFAPPSVVDLDQ